MPLRTYVLLICLACLGCVPSAMAQEDDGGFIYLEISVKDSEGNPLPNVPVDIRLEGSEFPMPTNREGKVAFNVPNSSKSWMRLKVAQPGYAGVAASWQPGERPPESFEFQLEKGTTIGGIIHDEQGQPIEGVEIEATLSNSPEREGGGKLYPVVSGVIATTDSDGRWRYEAAPNKRVQILLDFKHPDYVYENIYGYRGGNWEELHSLNRIVVLEKGVELQGQVTDPDGLPVPNAKVTLAKGRYYSDEQFTMTDAEGKYHLPRVKEGWTQISVLTDDWAPETRRINAKQDTKAVDFQLERGELVTFRFVDQDGEPIAGMTVEPHTWREVEIIPRSDVKSDENGLWQWDRAPRDAIDYRFFQRGYMSSGLKNVLPSEQVREVVIPPELVFTGEVTDAATGQPIEQFQVVKGIYWRETDDDVVWQEHRKVAGKNGGYRVAYNSGYAGFKVKIEAEGYRPAISELTPIDAGEVKLDFALEAGAGPAGVVRLPDGTPAAGADVMMATARKRFEVQNGEPNLYDNSISTKTDALGKFQLSFPEGNFAIICLHEQGWARIEAKAQETDLEITLEPWARIEGTLYNGDQPADNQSVALRGQRNFDRNQLSINWWNRVRTDPAGNFVFPRVRAGEATLLRVTNLQEMGAMESHPQPLQVEAGETHQVTMGGNGRRIVGQLELPSDLQESVRWQRTRVRLRYWIEPLKSGEQPTSEQKAEYKKSGLQSYASKVEADGSFTVEDVLPGKYWLDVNAYSAARDERYNLIKLAAVHQVVQIPDATGDNAPAEIGTFTLQPASDNQ